MISTKETTFEQFYSKFYNRLKIYITNDGQLVNLINSFLNEFNDINFDYKKPQIIDSSKEEMKDFIIYSLIIGSLFLPSNFNFELEDIIEKIRIYILAIKKGDLLLNCHMFMNKIL